MEYDSRMSISNDPTRETLSLPPWVSSDELKEPVVFTPEGPVPFSEIREYITKDSGKREEYASGMVRDVNGDKPRFDLILPEGIPYEEQFLTRIAMLLTRGAVKYGERNWEKASGEEEMNRFRGSALRHLMQWMCGETDEDHAAAVVFNILSYETTKWKRDNAFNQPSTEG